MPRGNETILVVDDDANIRRLIADVLTALGYTCLSAADGDEALEIGKKQMAAIDLLLTDVVMPGMNGRALAEAMKALKPGLRVVFMSGYTENTITHYGILDQGLHYLAKPVTPPELARKIRSVLDADEPEDGNRKDRQII